MIASVLEIPFRFVLPCPQERLNSPGKSVKGEGGWTCPLCCHTLERKNCVFVWLSPSNDRVPKGVTVWTDWNLFFKPLAINPLSGLQYSADLFAARERIYESDVNPPTLPAVRQPSASLSSGIQWADLAAIQSQLQIQSQVYCNYLFMKATCARPSIWCGRCKSITEFKH